MNPRHTTKTVEHYTPESVVEAARKVLGAIDLDPASCALANATVKAARYFDREHDGLTQQWSGRVFLNPPGGLVGRKSSAVVWWDKLVRAWNAGDVSAAIFVGFNIEILRSAQSCYLPVQAFARCYPRSRLRFDGDSPTHANVIAYLHPTFAGDCGYQDFADAFSRIGLCEPGSNHADR